MYTVIRYYQKSLLQCINHPDTVLSGDDVASRQPLLHIFQYYELVGELACQVENDRNVWSHVVCGLCAVVIILTKR